MIKIESLKSYTIEKELSFIIREYFLSLLGIVWDKDELKIHIVTSDEVINSNITLLNNKIIFLSNKNSNSGFEIEVSETFKESYLSRTRPIYDEILKVTYNNFEKGTGVLNDYDCISKMIATYEWAVQKGICKWLADMCAESFNKLLCTLENWSTKTYEGKKVPFAFCIDFQSSQGTFNYLDFLEEEYSATFSDGITSIIELDKNLCFVKYNSLTENNIYNQVDLSTTPLRFSQVIMSFTKNKIGVLLLTNGDLVIIKNKKIELIKRNAKWVNFNKDVFVSTVMSVNKTEPYLITESLLNALYYTSLDVSFSHSGGLISVIRDKKMLVNPSEYKAIVKGTYNNKKDYGVISYIDDIQTIIPKYEELKNTYPKYFDDSKMKKRFNKRIALLEILKEYKGNNTNKLNYNIKFESIDRKLRAELVSMDGATIIDSNGYVISFGAIIKNDSGSYGGGRGAAARKLSKYGLAIKISTDGYIEVYIDGEMKYKMK